MFGIRVVLYIYILEVLSLSRKMLVYIKNDMVNVRDRWVKCWIFTSGFSLFTSHCLGITYQRNIKFNQKCQHLTYHCVFRIPLNYLIYHSNSRFIESRETMHVLAYTWLLNYTSKIIKEMCYLWFTWFIKQE